MPLTGRVKNYPYPRDFKSFQDVEDYLKKLRTSLLHEGIEDIRSSQQGLVNIDLDDLKNTTLVDPDADRIVFWDDGAGVYTWLTANTGLAISTTNLNLSHLGLESLADPGADRIFFWDDGEIASKWLTATEGVQISATSLKANIGGLGADASPDAAADYVMTLDATDSTHKKALISALTGVDVKAAIDSGATADYIGAAYNDGVLRVDQNELTYTDGGNYITLGLADHNTARTALGLAIGSDVQAHNTVLTELTALTDPGADKIPIWDESVDNFVFLTLADELSINATPTLSVDHDLCTNFASNEHYLQTAITNISTALATGIVHVTTTSGALSSVAYSGNATDFLAGDGNWLVPAGSGDVSAAANINDDYVVKGDGGAKGIQDSNLYLTDAGLLALNETADADITIGFSMNQGGNDDFIGTFKSSDVAHGATTIMETDSFGGVKKAVAASGGLQIYGMTAATYGFLQYSLYANDDATKSTAGLAASMIQAAKISGTGRTNMGDDANIFCVRSRHDDDWGTRWIIDTEGTTWQEGNIGAVNAVLSGTVNELTLTKQTTGFTIAGGTTPKTLTMNDTFNVSTQLTAIGNNTTHRGSVGTDHGYIDQDLQVTATPQHAGLTSTAHIKFTAAGTNRDICFSTLPSGNDYIRIIATDTLAVQPTGAAIQFFANSMAGYNGQIFFDTGANDAAAIIFRTAPSSTNIAERMRIGSDGHLDIYDWDDSTMREVDFGADDSGGSGYKVLRIPN